jgi:hypothetical protein
MAQTNYTPIQLYYSTTAAAVPVNTNLLNGELAINITDGKLYYKDNSGTVQVIATKGAGTIGGSTTQIQYNNAGALAGSSAMTFNNSTNVVTLTTLNLTNALGAIYGGTGLTSYTTGDLLYSSASNTLAKLAIGTANYILTVNSGGTNVQWSAPSSISVSTATNLAGGAAGSVPYQSAAATTTFLAIGAADRVMTSSGTAPQWVTALTGLTGVSSSSITNTSLTSGRVVYSGASGVETDSANLTFNGTTLTTTGLSNSGTSALVRLVTVGDTSFNGATVFAAATPAKLYMGTGTVTDTTSAIGATNAVGAVASLAITPIAATNTSVTYTNASTLYIAGAPSAGTNITITNPYALYVAAGASYLGGNTAVTGTFSSTLGATIQGLTVGLGGGAVSTNTAVGASALAANTTGSLNTAVGGIALDANTTGAINTAVGYDALGTNTTGSQNNAFGYQALALNNGSNNNAFGVEALENNTTGGSNSAFGEGALRANTTASNNTAVGYQALYSNTTASDNTVVGYQAGYANTTGTRNAFFGHQAGFGVTTGSYNTAVGSQTFVSTLTGSENTTVGYGSSYSMTGGQYNTAVGRGSLFSNTTASYSTAVGYQAGYNNTAEGIVAVGNAALRANTTGTLNTGVGNGALYTNTIGSSNVALGHSALFSNTTASNNTAVGYQAGYTNSTGIQNVFLGYQAGRANSTNSGNVIVGGGIPGSQDSAGFLSTGAKNTYVGASAGATMTSGSSNTILGNYNGFQGGLDMRNASNWVVLSDGDGNMILNVQSAASIALQGNTSKAGIGITFPATQSASTDANTLDDYEEGTFTPGAGTQGGSDFTITSQVGSYTKIGNTVNVRVNIIYSAVGSGTIVVIALPPGLALDTTYPVNGFGGVQENSSPYAIKNIQIQVYSSSQVFLKFIVGATAYYTPASDLYASGTISFNATYKVS